MSRGAHKGPGRADGPGLPVRLWARACAAASDERGGLLPRAVATAFLVLAPMAAAVNIAVTPPFQTPDAFVQFDRAVEISYGQLVGGVQDGQAGSTLPQGVVRFERPFEALPFHPRVKVSPRDFRYAAAARWGGPGVFVPFGSTTEYPPFLYLPGALAVAVGRLVSNRVIFSYYLLEVVNAAVFIALLALALSVFRGGAQLLLAFVALLPMEVALAASPSTDGLLFALICVFAAVLYRSTWSRGRPTEADGTAVARTGSFRWLMRPHVVVWALATVSLTAAVMAKPPYLVLVAAVTIPWVQRRDWSGAIRVLAATFAVVAGAAALWYRFGARVQGAYRDAPRGTSVPGQLHYLLHHLAAVPTIVDDTLHVAGPGVWDSFVGNLGWLDTPLPGWLYIAATLALCLLVTICALESRATAGILLVALGTVVITVGAVAGALYLDWNPVGATVVDGLQGRYFLPLVPIALVALGPERYVKPAWVTRLALFAVVGFTCAEIASVGMTLWARYWVP